MSLILPGNVASALGGGYEVANSCRFNDDDSPKLTKTVSGSSTTKGTFSVWVKRCSFGEQCLFATQAGSNEVRINFTSGDALTVFHHDGSYQTQLITNRLFRDVSAWYHIMIVIDTTQGTDTNRVKFYINGTQDTSFSTANWPAEDSDSYWFQSADHFLGTEEIDSNYFDGYLAELVMCQGQALTPTSFGEFDSDSPTIWKPIDVSGLTFGTSGYYLDFEDSANLGNDANGGTDFTEANLAAADQATDTPTNNFATLNPNMAYPDTNVTFSEGNLSSARSASPTLQNAIGSMAASSGKWYVEVKVVSAGTNGLIIGFVNLDTSNLQNLAAGPGDTDTESAGMYSNGGPIFYNAGSTFATVGAYTGGDIIQLAMDIDNGYLYWGKNGTWLNSGDPESASSGTGGLALSNLTSGGTYTVAAGMRSGGDIDWNFGNPPFTISSSNSDANGYGNMEYAIPSGYYVLNSKNLAEFG